MYYINFLNDIKHSSMSNNLGFIDKVLFSNVGKQKFGIEFNHSVQSMREIEKDSIKAAMATVHGENNNDLGSKQ